MSQFLIVDDSLDSGRVLARLLRDKGHEAAFVENANQAMRFLEAHVPHVVLLDWMMPGMDGCELLRAVRADRRFDEVKVVMFSAVSEPGRIGDTLRMGAQDFILKGTPWEAVYSRLSRVLADGGKIDLSNRGFCYCGH